MRKNRLKFEKMKKNRNYFAKNAFKVCEPKPDPDEFVENASPEAVDAQIRAGEQMNSDS